jgi:hypothetical protein
LSQEVYVAIADFLTERSVTHAVKPNEVIVPSWYKCSCGKTGVKLWRTFEGPTRLICAQCGAAENQRSTESIDEFGESWEKFGRTDFLGSFAPAIPVPDKEQCYSLYVALQAMKQWWQALPTSLE